MTLSYENLREFIALLEEKGELIRIKASVSPILEITEITDRVAKSQDGGRALLFENVAGSSFPVLTNAFGSRRRIALALGTESPDHLANRLQEILTPPLPQNIFEKLRLLKQILGLGRFFPRYLKMSPPPCQEVVLRGEEVDLGKLPVLRCWPEDGGPFITLPVVFTRSLAGKRNAGMYRMQVFDRNTTGMHWHTHKDGAHFFREYEREGKRMEVAVAIGTEPAVTYAASAPLPPGIDEMLLAGFIRQKPVRLVPALTVDLQVPAEAEIILEGYVDPRERRREGPFGDHTGYYSLPDLYPVFHVTAMTHRRQAVYSTTVVGRPPMEDCYLAQATERLFLPLLRTLQPEIRDYRLPWEGVFHNLAVVAIDKEYPGQARKVMQGLWGSGQMSFCKTIVVVDGKTRLDDGLALFQEILTRIDLESDVLITEGILDVLDHAAPRPCFGGKLGIDATERLPGEPQRALSSNDKKWLNERDINALLKASDECFREGRLFFAASPLPIFVLPIIKTPEKRGAFFRDLLMAKQMLTAGIVVLYDAGIDRGDPSLLLWKAFNNVDPHRDISLRDQLAVIDATVKTELDGHKRLWPADLVNTPEICRRVSDRWTEYGIPTPR